MYSKSVLDVTGNFLNICASKSADPHLATALEENHGKQPQ